MYDCLILIANIDVQYIMESSHAISCQEIKQISVCWRKKKTLGFMRIQKIAISRLFSVTGLGESDSNGEDSNLAS